MELFTRIRAAAIIGALALAAPFAAHADTIVETATLSDDSGDYTVIPATSRFFGATFTLSQKTELTSVGFGYGRFGGGTVFAAIVPVDPSTGFPLADAPDLEASALAFTLINEPAVFDLSQIGDATAALSLTLDPGTYAVVFGAGLFGAAGTGTFSESDQLGAQNMFTSFFGSDWEGFSSANSSVRLLLDGDVVADTVPEPMTLVLMLTGLLGVAFLARGRSASPSFA